MWLDVFRFEYLAKARLPQTWVILAALFTAGLLAMAGSAEAFDTHRSVGADTLKADAPLQLWRLFQFFRWPMLLLLPLLVAESLHKDFSSRMYLLLYAYPLQRRAYLGGKLANGILWAATALLALTLGVMLGRYWPGVNTALFSAFHWQSYWQAMLCLGSTTFWVSVLLFGLVLHFKSIYPTYAALVVLWLLSQLARQALGGFGWEITAALFDPTNEAPVKLATQYWLEKDINTQPLPITGVMLGNHALYWILSCSIFAFAAYRFRFNMALRGERNLRNREVALPDLGKRHSQQPRPTTRESRLQPVHLMFFLVAEQLRYILSGRMFYLLLSLGGALLLFQQHNQNPTYGFDLLPTTWHLLKLPAFVYSGLVIVMTFLYTGRLLHRARSAGMQALQDVCPVSNSVWLWSIFSSISLLQLLMLLAFLICGLLVQYAEGFSHYQLQLYLFELLVLHGISYVLWTALSLLVYTLLKQWQLGLIVLLLVAAGGSALADLGIRSYLLRLFQAPAYTYSDWNGYNGTLAPYLAYKGYWLAFAMGLLALTGLCWQREAYHSWRERLHILIRRFRGKRKILLAVPLTLWLAIGAWLYQTEQAAYQSQPLGEMQWRAALEKQFGHFRGRPSPKITAIKLEVTITPHEKSWSAKGRYTLENTSSSPIDTLLIYTHPLLQAKIHWDIPAIPLPSDTLAGISLWVLERPLQPGSKLAFNCYLRQTPPHWLHPESTVGQQASVLSDAWFPSVGFPANLAIQSPILRKQYRLPPLAGYSSTAHSYSCADADRIQLETRIKAPKGYTGLAPGLFLRKLDSAEWTTHHYRAEVPIKHNFAIYLGPYEKQVSSRGSHTISSYYHPAHSYNLEALRDGLAAGLAYAEENYGPAQHKDWRIVEFPLGEGTHATLMANQLLFSEAYLLFDRKEAKIDLPFYVAVHEMAHHWWGNQLLPADAPGAKMLTESLAEYTALQVLRQERGEAAYRQLLEYNLDLYQRGRRAGERPLYLAKVGQQYIHYRKGALAFCALADCWDAAALNSVLQCFLEDYRLQGAPYPVAAELLERLKTAAPDDLHPLVIDYFEQPGLNAYQKEGYCHPEER